MNPLSSAAFEVGGSSLSYDSLADATGECIRNLELCTLIPILQSTSWAENRLAEFRLWVASLGVLAPFKASLAYRLQIAGEKDTCLVILQLLKLLNDHLELCISEGESNTWANLI